MPGLIVVAVGVLLFSFASSGAFTSIVLTACGGAGLTVVTYFNLLLGALLTTGTVYFIYRLCGKPVNWWTVAVGVAVVAYLLQPSVFCVIDTPFAALVPAADKGSPGYVTQMIAHAFLKVGILEEAIKAAPILLCWWIGMKLTGPIADKLRISEPLDGVLVGAFVDREPGDASPPPAPPAPRPGPTPSAATDSRVW